MDITSSDSFQKEENSSLPIDSLRGFDDDYLSVKRVLFGVLLTACFLISMILNFILLVMFLRRRSFRKETSNRFLMNLVVLNTFSTLVLDPLFLVDVLMSSGREESFLCGVSSFVSAAVATISMYSQFLIALDQYMAVVTPLKYTHRVNRIRCVILCTGVWIWGILWGIAFASTSESGLFEKSCQKGEGSFAIHFLNSFFNFICPLTGLICFYRRIFNAARENTIRTRRNSSIDGLSASNNNIHLLPPSSPSVVVVDDSSSSNNNNNTLKPSMKSKITHASAATLNMILHPESTLDGGKAAKIILLSLNAICASWAPFFFVHFVVLSASKGSSVWLFRLATVAASLSPILSSMLYAFRSRRIRREIRLAFKSSSRSDPLRSNGFTCFNSGINGTGKKMRRLRSFSCPQLLITSIDDHPIHPETKNKSVFRNDVDVKNLIKKAIMQQRLNNNDNNNGEDVSKRRSTLPVPEENHGMISNACSFPNSLQLAKTLSP